MAPDTAQIWQEAQMIFEILADVDGELNIAKYKEELGVEHVCYPLFLVTYSAILVIWHSTPHSMHSPDLST